MSRILTKEQYDWAVARVEEMLPQVGEDTPTMQASRHSTLSARLPMSNIRRCSDGRTMKI